MKSLMIGSLMLVMLVAIVPLPGCSCAPNCDGAHVRDGRRSTSPPSQTRGRADPVHRQRPGASDPVKALQALTSHGITVPQLTVDLRVKQLEHIVAALVLSVQR